MANVVIKIRIMPESIEVDTEALKIEVLKIIKTFSGREDAADYREETTPVAFGLKAIDITFVHDEKKGGTDPLEDILRNTEGVGGVEVLEVKRAIG